MRRHAHEYEFLPAALEVQETPPSPLGRSIAWGIVLLFVSIVTWASIGRVDIVAVAPGRIIPQGRSKLIQPLEMGTVRAIHVTEGQVVRKGDVLIELDATSTGADQQRIRQELLTAELEAAGARALVQNMKTDSKRLVMPSWPDSAEHDMVTLREEWLRGQVRRQRASLAAVDDDIRSRQAELAATRATIHKLEGILPLIEERVAAVKALQAKGMAARAGFLDLEQQRIETEQDLEAARNRVDAIRAAIGERRQRRRAMIAGFQATALQQATEAERRVRSLRQELIKARRKRRLQILAAPVDGVVQQLAIHTRGGVVTPAQTLMVIVPRKQAMEIEAWIANRDIGFIHPGQPARVKVDAFPFTRYGILDATLKTVSRDAIADEKRGWSYSARLILEEDAITVDGKQVALSPGMTVTVEIRTGERRLIEYFLSPLIQHLDESLMER